MRATARHPGKLAEPFNSSSQNELSGGPGMGRELNNATKAFVKKLLDLRAESLHQGSHAIPLRLTVRDAQRLQ